MTSNPKAIRDLFDISHNRATDVEPQAAIFPGNAAPVVRRSPDGERELLPLFWGFVLNMKGQAPRRVVNVRDDKLQSPFWRSSFEQRRCLVPVTAFSEPKGRRPAIWHWFALGESRRPFAFAGIWRNYRGPIRKDHDAVDVDVFAFLTTTPNSLVATIHPSRMPVMLVGEAAHTAWLDGTIGDACRQIATYPAVGMAIVQSDEQRADLGRQVTRTLL